MKNQAIRMFGAMDNSEALAFETAALGRAAGTFKRWIRQKITNYYTPPHESFKEGRWDIDEATRLIQRDTRRYAKRQLTWFRADPDTIWVDPDYKPGIINEVLAFIRATT